MVRVDITNVAQLNRQSAVLLQQFDPDSIYGVLTRITKHAEALITQGVGVDLFFGTANDVGTYTALMQEPELIIGDRRSQISTRHADPGVERLVQAIDEQFIPKTGVSFGRFFGPADYKLETSPTGVYASRQNGGALLLKNDDEDYFSTRSRPERLEATCERIWKESYNLQAGEHVQIGVALYDPNLTDKPREDYLDGMIIGVEMARAAQRLGAKVSLLFTTEPKDDTIPCTHFSQLYWTMQGLEFNHDQDETVFEAYRTIRDELSNGITINNFSALFNVSGDGRLGQFSFGAHVGFPIQGSDERWDRIHHMITQNEELNSHASLDPRSGVARYSMTQTLPLDDFVLSCDISYEELEQRNQAIKTVLDKCDTVRTIGDYLTIDGVDYKTDFTISLIKPGGGRRNVESESGNVRELEMFGNHCSGEVFVTPDNVVETREDERDLEYLARMTEIANKYEVFGDVIGTYVGNGVICIGRNYSLQETPMVIGFNSEGKAKILYASDKVRKAAEDCVEATIKSIEERYKAGSITEEQRDLKLGNLWNIGEFAINTNPNAPANSRYLIVAEKEKGKMHIALHSGFEPDKDTEIHWDTTAGLPQQVLNMHGFDSVGERYELLIQGEIAAK